MYFFQWFFVRLTKHLTVDDKCENDISYYSIQGFILPLTGWWSDYIRLTKPFYFKL